MSTPAKTTASKSTTSKVGAVSTKPAAKRAPRKAAAPKAPAPAKAAAKKATAPAKAPAKAPRKTAASFTTDEHPDTFTCQGACGETKPVKAFPTVAGPTKRAATCRTCRDAARAAKAA